MLWPHTSPPHTHTLASTVTVRVRRAIWPHRHGREILRGVWVAGSRRDRSPAGPGAVTAARRRGNGELVARVGAPGPALPLMTNPYGPGKNGPPPWTCRQVSTHLTRHGMPLTDSLDLPVCVHSLDTSWHATNRALRPAGKSSHGGSARRVGAGVARSPAAMSITSRVE